ncbi:hypothetical protein RS030_213324 [Cryptosporidium xiaoi]|uniref:Uncharacterized protein n=1 Tax=Cryptosporidium xiaoi TaxID=659607 RepID=A0AAV9XX24_9CRYT
MNTFHTLETGRLICEKEKDAFTNVSKCLYCGFEISLAEKNDDKEEDEHKSVRNKKKDDVILIPKNISSSEEVGHYIEAVEKRNRIINYAKNANRMRVIDEEVDWYSEYENQWNTKEERMFALKMSNEYIEKLSKSKLIRSFFL